METRPRAQEYRQKTTQNDVKSPTALGLTHPTMNYRRRGIRHVWSPGRVEGLGRHTQ